MAQIRIGYKSWYLYYYDLAKKEREKNVKTTLVDIDFNIELIRTDKINVVYILNLLKDVIKKDETEKKRSIDLILREIERSDNERLRAKQDMLKRFVTEKFFSLSPDEDIVKAYNLARMNMLGTLNAPENIKHLMKKECEEALEDKYHIVFIIYSEAHDFIGYTEFKNLDGTPEIGIDLAEKHQGKG